MALFHTVGKLFPRGISAYISNNIQTVLVVDIIIGYISGLRFDLMDDSGENIKKML